MNIQLKVGTMFKQITEDNWYNSKLYKKNSVANILISEHESGTTRIRVGESHRQTCVFRDLICVKMYISYFWSNCLVSCDSPEMFSNCAISKCKQNSLQFHGKESSLCLKFNKYLKCTSDCKLCLLSMS